MPVFNCWEFPGNHAYLQEDFFFTKTLQFLFSYQASNLAVSR